MLVYVVREIKDVEASIHAAYEEADGMPVLPDSLYRQLDRLDALRTHATTLPIQSTADAIAALSLALSGDDAPNNRLIEGVIAFLSAPPRQV